MSTKIDWLNDICVQAGHVGAMWQNKLYVFGGTVWLNGKASDNLGYTNEHLRVIDFTKDVDISQTQITTLSRVSNVINPGKWLPFFSVNGKLRFFGGETEPYTTVDDNGNPPPANYTRPGYAGMLWSYDIDTSQWSARNASGIPYAETPGNPQFTVDPKTNTGWVYGGSYYDAGYRVGTVSKPGLGNGKTYLEKMYKYDLVGDKLSVVDVSKTINKMGQNSAGAMQFIPDLGGQGVLVAFGGDMAIGAFRSMETVFVFDIATSVWYPQKTSTVNGKYPAGRIRFCTVAATASDNSSFNIYMYGGVNGPGDDTPLNDMWILSIPSFHWVPVAVESRYKASLTCHKLQERYMVAYRGRPVDKGCDLNQGIQLFDLTTLKWTTKYEVSKEDNPKYKLPADLYYVLGGNADGGSKFQKPQSGFANENLEALFSPMLLPNGTSTTPTNGATTPPKSTEPSGNGDNSSSKVPVGAIVGGVIGGLFFIALLGWAFFWYRSRKRPATAAMLSFQPRHPLVHEIDTPRQQWEAEPGVMEHYGMQGKPLPPRELQGAWQPTELEGHLVGEPTYEMHVEGRKGSPAYEPQSHESLIGAHR